MTIKSKIERLEKKLACTDSSDLQKQIRKLDFELTTKQKSPLTADQRKEKREELLELHRLTGYRYSRVYGLTEEELKELAAIRERQMARGSGVRG
ncbi:MAG: hypothetical protein HPY50_07145 [Firmicutes bacterium]|nr:hypothetical protein [Bacillota bacterium]